MIGVNVPEGGARKFAPLAPRPPLNATLVSTDTNGIAVETTPSQKPLNDFETESAALHARPGNRGGNPDAPRLPMPDKWYTASELDVRAEPVSRVDFAYPPNLERIIGRVEIALFIDEQGNVKKAQVLAAEPEKLFDEAALNGWRNVRFSPAMRGGVAVKSEKIVQVDFQPDLFR